MPDPADVAAAVARNVRSIRKSRQFSLDALAARSGVSKGMLVQLEQGRTNPSVVTLARLSDALGVTIARLVELSDEPSMRVVRASDAVVLWSGDAGGQAKLLIGADEEQGFELWQWTLGPGDRHDSMAHTAGTVEVLHILSGVLDLVVAGRLVALEPGDVVRFPANRPHTYRNETQTQVVFELVVLVPPFARHMGLNAPE